MDVLRQFTAIGLTLLLLAGSLWWLRRKGLANWGRARPGRVLEVIESRTLAPGHTLHLVRIADRVLALATHNGGCTLLEARQYSEVRRTGGPGLTAAILILLFSKAASAAATGSLLGISLVDSKGGSSIGVPMQITILMTLLALLPAAIMSVTPFLRISIVLHFLRQALGTQTIPSNQVLVGLSMFLTMIIVGPVFSQIHTNAWVPMQQGTLTQEQAIEEAGKPLKVFLAKYAREKDIKLFLEISHAPAPRTPKDLDLKVLIPAYIISELKTGFQIGAVLFLPFLVIDIVVASVTLSIGMVQLPPVMLSAPFKILLFVLVDGWNLLIGSLIKSFY